MELLPAGFRFFPTDEELITCYLARKAMDDSFTSPAIRDVDLYKSEPWDLPCEQQQQAAAAAAAAADLQEGYFFCRRGSKYPSGVRARRATRLGYWKSTGKDKAVHGRNDGGRLVGTRKTLVFYRGRAPRGEKTGWVMHEYAMGDKSSSALLRGAQSEWVICKVFMRKQQHPTSGQRKVMTTEETTVHEHDQGSTTGLLPMAPDGCGDDEQEAVVPPLVVADSRSQQLTINHSGAHAMDGNEKDPNHHQMVSDEIPAMMMNQQHGLVCASPSWFNHDDQLGAHCLATPILQMQPDDTDYYLPELLEHDGCDDLLNAAGSGLLDSGGAVSQSSEIISAAIGPLHLDGLHWNFGF